jgi:hypothetical protein
MVALDKYLTPVEQLKTILPKAAKVLAKALPPQEKPVKKAEKVPAEKPKQ